MEAVVDISEFPFMANVPKKKARKAAAGWELAEEIKQLTKERGYPYPAGFAATLVGISRQRIHQLIDQGTLRGTYINDHLFICESDLEEFAKSERKSGRPARGTVKEALAQTGEVVRAFQEAGKKKVKNKP